MSTSERTSNVEVELSGRLLAIVAVAMALLAVSAQPVAAGHANLAVASEHSSASELSTGSISNANIERSGEFGYVGYDTYRPSANSRWAFDAGSGETAYDHAGGNDLSVSNSGWTSGLYGSALDLSGDESINTGFTQGGNFTISVAVKTTTTGQVVYHRKDGTISTSGEFQLNILSDGRAEFQGWDIENIQSTTNVADGNWHVVTVRAVKNEQVSISVDGEVEDIGGSSSINSYSTGVTVSGFQGSLDEFRTYGATLSPGLANRLGASPATKLSPNATERWAFDASGRSPYHGDEGNDMTPERGSPNWTSGYSNTAIEFDGDDRVASEQTIDTPDSFTISGWTQVTKDSYQSLAGKGVYDGIYIRRDNNGAFAARLTFDDGSNTGFVEGGSIPTGEWVHWTVTWDNSVSSDNLQLYVNGQLVKSVTAGVGKTINANDRALMVGDDGSGTYDQLEGKIDEYRVYHRAISASEVQHLTDHPAAQLPESSSYTSENQSASGPKSAWIDITLSNVTASVEWQAWNSSAAQWQVVNSSTHSSTGNYTLDISGTDYDTWRVNVTFDKTGSTPTAQLHDEGILVETKAPTVDNQSATPDTTGQSVDSPVDLTVSVDDSDFSNAGDSLTVDYYVDGSQVGSKQTSSAGEVTYTLSDVDAGSHSWHVEVHDEYGHTIISETFNFTTASSLQILDEENPSQLVKDNVTVTVRLYADDTVTKREVSDGTVDMSGLPLNSTIVATTQADGWIDRRVLIRDLTQQQEIYLLNSSSNAISVAFDLQDKSGNFPEDNSQLYVQKALNTTNTDGLEWQTVTGDYFGADGSFPTQLLYQQRYRLVIRNSQGDRRVLGNFIPTESGSFPVEIGKIVWDPPEGESVYATSETRNLSDNADHTYNNSSSEVFVEYYDSEDATTKLTINVSVRGNESLYSATVYDVQSHTESIPLTATQANKSLVVNVTAERTGEDFEHTWQHGTPGNVDTGADRGWLSLGAQVTLLALVGLVAGSMPKKGGLVVVPAAFGVSWMGWWQIHPASLSMMGVIALFSAARSRGGGA
jgi:hypothetical protein